MIILDYTKIKYYYDNGFWTKSMVWDAVSKNKITTEQYTQITGDEYPSDRPSDTE